MPDQQLRVVITADASGVGPGVAQATAAVTASADQIASAQARATAATKALKDAQVQLGAAAEAGNAQAASILGEYSEASAAASAALNELTAAQEANTAATVADTAAQERDTAVTYNRMEAMGAARVGLGAATGSVGAMEYGLARLAAGSSALGPILASMVPVVAIAAGVFIIGDLVKGIVEFSEKAQALADETGSDWLTGAIGQMDGLAEAVKQADAEVDSLNKDLDSLTERGQKDAIETIRLTQGEASALRAQAELKRGNEAANERALTLLKQQAAALKEQAEYAPAQVLTGPTGSPVVVGGPTTANLEAAKQLEVVNKQIADYQATDNDLLTEAGNLDLQASQTKEKKGSATRENYENEADALKLQGASLADILAFWEKINADGQHYAEVLRAQEALTRHNAELAKQMAEPGKLGGLNAAPAREPNFPPITGLGDLTTAQKEEQQYAQINTDLKEQLDHIDAINSVLHESKKLALFGTSPGGERQAADAASMREEMESIAAIQKQMNVVAPLGNFGGLDAKQLEEYKKLQQQMTEAEEKGTKQREQNAQKEAAQIDQLYKKLAETFNNDFERAFNEFATKSRTAGQAFGRMLGTMEEQLADYVARYILQQAEMWAEGKLLQKAAQESQIASDAGTAAANVYASVSAIPVIGWALAPAAAAAAFVGVEAYKNVFDTGGMMPHMGFAHNTSGSPERVLSPSQTANFESLVNQGGARSATLNYSPTIGGGVSEDMLKAHSAQMMQQLRGMLRPEAFA